MAQTSKKDKSDDDVKAFVGTYQLESSENFDGFLKEIGVGLIYRKMADAVGNYGSYPVLDFSQDQEKRITASATIPFWTQSNSFKIGQEFNEVRMDGKMCKSIIEPIGQNRYVQTQQDGSLAIKYVYQFEQNQLQVTAIANNVQCFRVYKRVH